jgi:coenzyme PQQ precursor peptide PqqA
MSAESSLLSSALEGKQIAKGQKVTGLVPRVEKRAQNARNARVMQILATLLRAISSQARLGRRAFIFPGVLISAGGSAILTKRSQLSGEPSLGEIMEWTAPAFEEVCLNCEINSYASAKL